MTGESTLRGEFFCILLFGDDEDFTVAWTVFDSEETVNSVYVDGLFVSENMY